MRVKKGRDDFARIHRDETTFGLAVFVRVSRSGVLSRVVDSGNGDNPAIIGHGAIDNTVAGDGYRSGYDALGHVIKIERPGGEVEGNTGLALLERRVAQGVRNVAAVILNAELRPANLRIEYRRAETHVINPDRLCGFVQRRIAVAIRLAGHALDDLAKIIVVARSEDGLWCRSRKSHRPVQQHIGVIFEFDEAARLKRDGTAAVVAGLDVVSNSR